jgi:uncharacterized protein with von Willebrand factor type A (vWA) domain
VNYVALPPNRWDETALMAWVEHFFNGGTTLDVLLVEMPAKWPELIAAGMTRGKTDMIFITDAEVECPPEMAEAFAAFKKRENVKVTTIGVQVHEIGDLEPLSDRIVCVPDLIAADNEVADILSV